MISAVLCCADGVSVCPPSVCRAVLPIELLHGITFACGWGAGTINSKRVAPPELAATMQVSSGSSGSTAVESMFLSWVELFNILHALHTWISVLTAPSAAPAAAGSTCSAASATADAVDLQGIFQGEAASILHYVTAVHQAVS